MWTAEARQRYSCMRRRDFASPTRNALLVEPHLPEHASPGRWSKHTLRTVLDAIPARLHHAPRPCPGGMTPRPGRALRADAQFLYITNSARLQPHLLPAANVGPWRTQISKTSPDQ